MVTREEIAVLFQDLQTNPSNEVLDKCKFNDKQITLRLCFPTVSLVNKFVLLILGVSMCHDYNISAEDLVDEWHAYAASKLRDATPSLEALTNLERKELLNRKKNVSVSTPSSTKYGKYTNEQYPLII